MIAAAAIIVGIVLTVWAIVAVDRAQMRELEDAMRSDRQHHEPSNVRILDRHDAEPFR